jgi:hypothetical protein
VGLLQEQVAETRMRTKALLGISAFVVIWTLVVHVPRHWNPILAYPLYFGLAAHSLVVGQHQTLTWDKIGFAAELAANLAIYLAATLAISTRFKSSPTADKTTYSR